VERIGTVIHLDFLTADFFIFVLIGFGAQLIDGALGMAFGILTTTALLTMGIPPAVASAMTHVTEIFTTAASGASHVYHRNIDWRLVARLAPAGMLGGAIGAYTLANIDGDAIAPFISIYLIVIGVIIVIKSFKKVIGDKVSDWTIPFVGGFGGIMDAIGGGGWGPVVTSTLVSRGHDAKKVIGSTNLTEFLVTTVISATFILTLGWSQLGPAIGLILGGVVAAPIGALLVKKLPVKVLMRLVAAIIIATAAFRLFS
jgi:uncharacterized membrane protein YfcA